MPIDATTPDLLVDLEEILGDLAVPSPPNASIGLLNRLAEFGWKVSRIDSMSASMSANETHAG